MNSTRIVYEDLSVSGSWDLKLGCGPAKMMKLPFVSGILLLQTWSPDGSTNSKDGISLECLIPMMISISVPPIECGSVSLDIGVDAWFTLNSFPTVVRS